MATWPRSSLSVSRTECLLEAQALWHWAYTGWQIWMVVSVTSLKECAPVSHNRHEGLLCSGLGCGVCTPALWPWPALVSQDDGMMGLQRHALGLQFPFLSILLVLSWFSISASPALLAPRPPQALVPCCSFILSEFGLWTVRKFRSQVLLVLGKGKAFLFKAVYGYSQLWEKTTCSLSKLDHHPRPTRGRIVDGWKSL